MPELKTLRLRKFLTQRELGEVVGVPYQTIQRWEAGQSMPRPSHLKRLAEALGVSGAELLEAIEETKAKGAQDRGEEAA